MDVIFEAAYVCFTRHGVRRSTMDDIAQAAGMSRPALYQHVRNKNDTFRRLAGKLYGDSLDRAREAVAAEDGSLADRLTGALTVKLSLTLRLYRDSPHAAELLGHTTTVAAAESQAFLDSMAELLEGAIRTAYPRLAAGEPADIALLLLSMVRGLEADMADPEPALRRLRRGVSLLVLGLDEERSVRRAPASGRAGQPAAATSSQEIP